MNIQFAASVPDNAAVLAIPVAKDGMGSLDAARFGGDADLVRGAAQAGRFDGETGAIVEIFVKRGDGVGRILLIGVGAGSEVDYERAGGALTARFLTSGVREIAVDFSRLDAKPSATEVALSLIHI